MTAKNSLLDKVKQNKTINEILDFLKDKNNNTLSDMLHEINDDNSGNTPLHIIDAASKGASAKKSLHEKCIQHNQAIFDRIKQQFNHNKVNNQGEVVQFIKGNQAKSNTDITEYDDNGQCVLHYAAQQGNSDAVKNLLNRYSDKHPDQISNLLTHKDTKGYTPLELAAYKGDWVSVINLIEAVRNNLGETQQQEILNNALSIAQKNKLEIVEQEINKNLPDVEADKIEESTQQRSLQSSAVAPTTSTPQTSAQAQSHAQSHAQLPTTTQRASSQPTTPVAASTTAATSTPKKGVSSEPSTLKAGGEPRGNTSFFKHPYAATNTPTTSQANGGPARQRFREDLQKIANNNGQEGQPHFKFFSVDDNSQQYEFTPGNINETTIPDSTRHIHYYIELQQQADQQQSSSSQPTSDWIHITETLPQRYSEPYRYDLEKTTLEGVQNLVLTAKARGHTEVNIDDISKQQPDWQALSAQYPSVESNQSNASQLTFQDIAYITARRAGLTVEGNYQNRLESQSEEVTNLINELSGGPQNQLAPSS